MSWNEKLTATRGQLRGLNKTIPDTAKAFGALGKSVKEGGVLDYKTKEFVALGMAVVSRCEPCISLRCDALVKAGASKNEVADVLAMAIQMGGGPAMMYAGKALECFEELRVRDH